MGGSMTKWLRIADHLTELPEPDEPCFLADEKGNAWIGCRSYNHEVEGLVWSRCYGDIWSSFHVYGVSWHCDSEWDRDYFPVSFIRFPS